MALSDDLSRAAGGGVPIKFKGEDIILPPITMETVATVKQHLLRQRKPAQVVLREHIEALGDLATPELIEKMVADSMKAGRELNIVTDAELAQYIDTVDGVGMTLWVAFEEKYPGRFTKQEVMEVITQMAEKKPEEYKDLVDARDQAAAWDERGNSTGPTP